MPSCSPSRSKAERTARVGPPQAVRRRPARPWPIGRRGGEPPGGVSLPTVLLPTVLLPTVLLLAVLLLTGAGGCGVAPPDLPSVDPVAFLDPVACQTCHPTHYSQWEGSMHAYAGDDPVFLAMNARGQRETQGELGDFCVRCHAPVALKVGATTDGLNLPDLPARFRGVTCVWCHSVTDHHGEANAAVDVRMNGELRGGIEEPVANDFHRSAYSPLHDRDRAESSNLCGPCHDVVTPVGVHLERTFLEWQGTIFNADTRSGGLSCAACHMPGRDAAAYDAEEAPIRRIHDHSMPAVDVAITDWPDRDRQRALVQRELDGVVYSELCVDAFAGTVELTVTLENLTAGHHFPSGAAHDRRVWMEVEAREAGQVVFASGQVPDGVAVTDLELAGEDIWRLGDRFYKPDGEPAHMFWEGTRLESLALPAPTPDIPPRSPELHLGRTWFYVGGVPEEVRVRMRMRPIGLDVIDDLIASGDLDPALREEFPTFTLGATDLVWTPNDRRCVPAGRLTTPTTP